jgi:hypothetical protein
MRSQAVWRKQDTTRDIFALELSAVWLAVSADGNDVSVNGEISRVGWSEDYEAVKRWKLDGFAVRVPAQQFPRAKFVLRRPRKRSEFRLIAQ